MKRCYNVQSIRDASRSLHLHDIFDVGLGLVIWFNSFNGGVDFIAVHVTSPGHLVGCHNNGRWKEEPDELWQVSWQSTLLFVPVQTTFPVEEIIAVAMNAPVEG